MQFDVRVTVEFPPELMGLFRQLVGELQKLASPAVVGDPAKGTMRLAVAADRVPEPVPRPPPALPTAPALPKPSSVAAASSTPPKGSSSTFSPEQMAVLDRDYPLGIPRADIAAAMNALDGRNITVGRLSVLAAGRGLRRPGSESPPLSGLTPFSAGSLLAQPVKREPVPSPVPNADGKIEASFEEVRTFAARFRIVFDGSNMDVINKTRRALKIPEMVVVERTAG